jgi:hypothetical protein
MFCDPRSVSGKTGEAVEFPASSEVRGVLKSCVIASRKTDFKCSLSCVDGILRVCIRTFDPLSNNCGEEIESGFILCANFNSTPFYIAEWLILRPIRVRSVLNKTRSTSKRSIGLFRRRYLYARHMTCKCADAHRSAGQSTATK